MSLREQLRDILPQILPASPLEAIKGTELIRLVRHKLPDDYSDATLRYHFSILSYDPSSPIAKVDQGQGYYLRLNKSESRNEAMHLGIFGTDASPADMVSLRYARFRSVVERHCVHGGRYPFALMQALGGHWELPDMVITDWDFDADNDDAPRLDETMLNLKRHLGVSTVELTAAQLKLSITLDSCNEDFFKTLSATRWSNKGEILIAERVSDEALVETLRTLGHQHGVGITSFGLDLDLLDELPLPDDIRRMSAAEFESLQTLLKPQRISIASHRSHLDWQHLSTLKKKHECLSRMLRWLNGCLENRKPVWPARDREEG
jgi:hypothetical protein